MFTMGSIRASAAAALALIIAQPAAAQSLTAAALSGVVLSEAGAPVVDATITLERDGAAIRTTSTDRAGRFTFRLVVPGRHAVLAEQIGYQPLRLTDIDAVAGHEARITVRLALRPPPIVAPDERAADLPTTTAGRVVSGLELQQFDRHRAVSDVTRGMTQVDPARGLDAGFVQSANGLPGTFSRFIVDGVEERLLFHPGVPGAPAPTPLFARGAIGQAAVTTFGSDAESRGAPGAILSAQTAPGAGRYIRPFVAFSGAALGGAEVDNPADSSGASLQAGVYLGGSSRADTLAWSVHVEYQRLAMPMAAPFAGDFTPGGQVAVSTAAGRDVGAWLSPSVRRWTGFNGGGRVDLRLGTSALAIRAGFASWNEENPVLGAAWSSNAGSKVDGTDASASASFTTPGMTWLNELRVGLSSARREWTGSGVAAAHVAADAFAFGDTPELAGVFDERAFEIGDALSIQFGKHRFKVGGLAQRQRYGFDYASGPVGRFDFGTVGDLAAGTGTFTQTVRTAEADDIGVTSFAAFAQDAWELTPDVTITAGIRADKEQLPGSAVTANAAWLALSGVNTGIMPLVKPILAPRAALDWTPGGSGRTVVHLAGGIVPGRFDIASFAEVASHDGSVGIRRMTGDVTWPAMTSAPVAKPTLTLYGPAVRRPRTFMADGSLARLVAAGTTVSATVGYRHTDYLLRRTDLNTVPAQASTGSDGRPIFGALERRGGLIVPTLGSNRRFDEFDAVFALTSTGYVDYYHATLAVERRVTRGLALGASYTWSDATDNVPGSLATDPFDRLSPFADGDGTESWDDGVSDLDVPHRLAATVQYTAGGKLPLGLAARFRFRSGLPFTPGFRGVDANGDGSMQNDPAFLGAAIPGMSDLLGAHECLSSQAGKIAARNSCRTDDVRSLDLHASIGIPLARRRASVTVDLFNLVASESGLVDRAAVRVDPSGSITIDSGGRVVLPLAANPRFGTVLSRRTDPRMLRIGLRLEN